MELRNILKAHPAKWMIWEGEPMSESVERVKSMGLKSLVFDPCGNVPDQVKSQNPNDSMAKHLGMAKTSCGFWALTLIEHLGSGT